MLTFYADFACPYCYVENETLARLGVSHLVSFRPVSLLPNSAIPWDPEDEFISKILDGGWDTFVACSEGLEVRRPDSIPNTRLAAQAIAEVEACAPDQAPLLRNALFRAVWRENRDIGLISELLAVWDLVGLPAREKFSRDARLKAHIWQTEWKNGPFEARVPVIADADGKRLLGLPTDQALLAFLDDRDKGGHSAEVCG